MAAPLFECDRFYCNVTLKRNNGGIVRFGACFLWIRNLHIFPAEILFLAVRAHREISKDAFTKDARALGSLFFCRVSCGRKYYEFDTNAKTFFFDVWRLSKGHWKSNIGLRAKVPFQRFFIRKRCSNKLSKIVEWRLPLSNTEEIVGYMVFGKPFAPIKLDWVCMYVKVHHSSELRSSNFNKNFIFACVFLLILFESIFLEGSFQNLK